MALLGDFGRFFKTAFSGPEPPPPLPPLPPPKEDPEEAHSHQYKSQAAKRKKRNRTILTSGLGDDSEATISRSVLLGG